MTQTVTDIIPDPWGVHPPQVLTRTIRRPRGEVRECPTCAGTGAVRHSRHGAWDCPSDVITCPDCEGTGR